MNLKSHWGWYAAAAAFIGLLWLFSPILTPFVVAAGLAYLGDPLVDRLQRWKMSRSVAVSVVFAVFTLLGLLALLLIVPMLYKQSLVLLHSIPDWLSWLQDTGLPRLGIVLPSDVQLDAEGLKKMLTEHWSKAGGIAATVWAKVSQSGGALFAAAANLLLAPVVTFYLLRDWDDLVAWVRDAIPRRALPKVTQLASETDQVLGAFIRGQLLVMAALAALYSIGLGLAGLKLALVIGVVAGLVSFVPYLGFIVGIVSASLAMVVQTQEFLPLVWVALVFGIGQVIESAVLTPNLVGDKIGLHPVAVIFAVMAGGQLFGFIGVLMALPVAAVLAVLMRHAKEVWLQSPAYLDGAPETQPLALAAPEVSTAAPTPPDPT